MSDHPEPPPPPLPNGPLPVPPGPDVEPVPIELPPAPSPGSTPDTPPWPQSVRGVVALLPLLVMLGCARPLAEEPAQGMLRPGDVVRVDDGECPAGQTRRVTVGPAPADKTQAATRSSACVAR